MGNNHQAVPTFDKMLWPTVRALVEAAGSASNQELLDRVVQRMGLSENVQSVLHGEGPITEVAYRAAWARTYLRLADAIETNGRGVWSITAAGRTLTEEDVASIPARVRKRYPRRGPGNGTPEEEQPEVEWKDALLSVLKDMPADGFERLSQRILRESGFVKVEVTGKSGDGGIDGVGVLRLKLISFRVFFQCKRYKDTVSAGIVRDFRGAMVGRADKGLVITTGRFTPDAKKEATRDGAPPVELIDGDLLCDLLKEFNLGVHTRLVEQVTVEAGFFRDI